MKHPVLILIGVALGIITGLLLNRAMTPDHWSSVGVGDAAAFMAYRTAPGPDGTDLNAGATWIAQTYRAVGEGANFIGRAFLGLLRFIAVPMVFFSLIVGVASLGASPAPGTHATGSGDAVSGRGGRGGGGAMGGAGRALLRLGGRTVLLFAATTAVAIFIGLAVGHLVRPGEAIPPDERARLTEAYAGEAAGRVEQARAVSPTVWSVLLSAVPTNPFEALARGEMLKIVVMSVLLGGALLTLPRGKTAGLLNACEVAAEVMTKIIGWVMWTAPVAVFCLMAEVASRTGWSVVSALGVFCLAVVGGLLLHTAVVFAPLLRWMGGMSPLAFARGMAPALAVAFSTSSSSATLPVTIRCVRENLGVPARVASFVCPLGATINMNGTALYQALSALLIAQVFGVELTLTQQLMVVLTTVLASVGSPGIPGGGIIMFIVVLGSVGLPVEGVALILAVDRLLDLFRTVVNVVGDAVAAVVLARFEPSESPEAVQTEAGPAT
jgi:Na+/H+-dicarboxylate symporter